MKKIAPFRQRLLTRKFQWGWQFTAALVIWNFYNSTTCFNYIHCVKSIQIRSYFWSVFSCIWTECGEIWSISLYSVRIQENTDQKKLRIWTRFTQWYCTWSPALRNSKSFKEILKTKSQRQSPSDVL